MVPIVLIIIIIINLIIPIHFNLKLQEGSIGQDMVIKPVPYGLINDNSSNGKAQHIVYKRKVDTADQFSDFGKSLQLYDVRKKRIR